MVNRLVFRAFFNLDPVELMLMVNLGYIDDDDSNRRPQRRRYEEPPAAKLRRQLVAIAESVSYLQISTGPCFDISYCV